jgi:hypothetical protein
MESEGSNDIYRKGKIECLWVVLMPNCEFIIMVKMYCLLRKRKGICASFESNDHVS